MGEGMELALVLMLVAALQLAAHWNPARNSLHPVVRYVYGTLSILGGITMWAGVSMGAWEIVRGAWLCAAGAGLGTVTGYIYDWIANWLIRARNHARLREVCDDES